ncbi:MAG TPA: A24 family peptidase [Vicinamibacterales bacterium]|nr:A24 family peptidase [Vicinamibacterales bacterium]
MLTLLILSLGLAAAVVLDVRTRRIPNWLTGGIAAAGFGMAFGGGSVTPGQAALGLLAGLFLMMPAHVMGAMGAGDVKLMGAVGAVVGPDLALRAFLYSAVTGGVFALVVALKRGVLASTLQDASRLVTSPAGARAAIEAPARANRFAYGPAIAVGTLVSLMVTR